MRTAIFFGLFCIALELNVMNGSSLALPESEVVLKVAAWMVFAFVVMDVTEWIKGTFD